MKKNKALAALISTVFVSSMMFSNQVVHGDASDTLATAVTGYSQVAIQEAQRRALEAAYQAASKAAVEAAGQAAAGQAVDLAGKEAARLAAKEALDKFDATPGQSSIGEMTTDLAIQSAISLLGGIPIGQNVKYTFSSGGQLRSYVVCKTDNQKPEAYSTAQYACACYTVGGTCLPPVQTKSVEFTEGGQKAENMSFVSVRCTPKDGCRFGYAKSNVTSEVYNGDNILTPGGTGGAGHEDKKNKKDDKGTVQVCDQEGGCDPGPIGGGGTNVVGGNGGVLNGVPNATNVAINTHDTDNSGGGGNNPTGGNGNPEGGGNGKDPNGSNGDPNGDTNTNDKVYTDGDNIRDEGGNKTYADAIKDALRDNGNDTFNAADDDWSTSGGGGEGTDNLDDYLNGSMDGALNGSGEDLLGTTDDLFGLDDGLNSGFGGIDGNPFENAGPATLLDTDGNGTFDSIDIDGDGVPDATLIDTDGDGNPDAIDINGDGNPDGWLIDEDGDGVPDGIDYNGDGVIDQYLAGHGPFAGEEGEGLNGEGDFDPMEAQLLDMIRQQMAGNGNPLAPFGMGSGGEGSALDNGVFFNGLFGVDEETIRRNTASDQEMFDFARDLLKKLGLSEKDIMRGKQYSKNSAWTEPAKAWDFNRITTLLAKHKIKTTSSAQRDNKTDHKPATMSDAMNKK